MRYIGQVHECTVEIGNYANDAKALEKVKDAFHKRHEELYTYSEPHNAVEVVNITNPTLIHWTTDLLPLLHESGLTFDELPAREWVDKLRHSEQDPVANPPIKLLEFFAAQPRCLVALKAAAGRTIGAAS